MTDTIFALSSGALPAAIAVIRISGLQAFAVAERLAGPLAPPRRMALRRLIDPDGVLVDQVLVVRFLGPASATGEDLVELHCHGGRAVIDRLLVLLGDQDHVREAEPGEFTRRALMNGRLDLTEAEGLADLLAAQTEWQRRAAVTSAGGALRRQVEEWRERLVSLSAQAEAAIDYVDEHETELDLTQLTAAVGQLAGEWRKWLSEPRSELIQQGLKIVLAGPPNAGKSSLFNALLASDKAIVTPVAGTTRDLIEASVDWSGIRFTLVDTAGMRESDDAVERIGITRALDAQSEADILLWLGEPGEAPTHPALLQVHPRADERPPAPVPSFPTSVKTNEGLGDLQVAIIALAKTLLPPFDHAALNRRQAAALSEALGWLDEGDEDDVLLVAERLRGALVALDRLSGRRGIEDMLDALFSRFCLGK